MLKTKLKHHFIVAAGVGMFLTLWTSSGSAHCPVPLKSLGMCAELTWQNGPFINTAPRDRFFSTLEVRVFREGDTGHTAIHLDNLYIYPWMNMGPGQSHSTSFQESLTAKLNYRLDRLKFTHHKEGWTIRFALLQQPPRSYDETIKYIAEVPVFEKSPSGTMPPHH
jgi:hypothetical protein